MDFISFQISSETNNFTSERRFPRGIAIDELKNKLELLTGSQAANIQLKLYNSDNEFVTCLDRNDICLTAYPEITDGWRLHVVDKTAKPGEFEDIDMVRKFEISEDEYAKRDDSVRAFKQKMKLGQFREESEEEIAQREAEKQRKAAEEETILSQTSVGDRCEIRIEGQPTRRGVVMYKGETSFQSGNWIGVQYDEPYGKNDGSVKGVRYFTCPDKYGGFVRPLSVKVGDFPDFADELM